MTDELPPLPEPYTEAVVEYSGIVVNRIDRFPHYTADQMRAYAAAAVARERERAIDIVAMFGGSVEIEAAIRGGD